MYAKKNTEQSQVTLDLSAILVPAPPLPSFSCACSARYIAPVFCQKVMVRPTSSRTDAPTYDLLVHALPKTPAEWHSTHHYIVVIIPRQFRSDNHRSSDQWRHESSNGIEGVQEPLDCVGLVHGANPSAKARIGQSIAESADHVGHDECWIRGMQCQDDVCDDVAERGHDGHASLTKLLVDPSIGKCCDRVTGERSQKDQRDDSVAQFVVGFKLDQS